METRMLLETDVRMDTGIYILEKRMEKHRNQAETPSKHPEKQRKAEEEPRQGAGTVEEEPRKSRGRVEEEPRKSRGTVEEQSRKS